MISPWTTNEPTLNNLFTQQFCSNLQTYRLKLWIFIFEWEGWAVKNLSHLCSLSCKLALILDHFYSLIGPKIWNYQIKLAHLQKYLQFLMQAIFRVAQFRTTKSPFSFLVSLFFDFVLWVRGRLCCFTFEFLS